jgi:phospholipase/carboxylesterase
VTPPDDHSFLSRRAFLQITGVGAAGALAAGCDAAVKDALALPTSGRLSARPKAPTGTITPGEQALALADGGRDGLLYVPSIYSASKPAPLVVMLHGAGGSARGALRPFRELADEAGLVLLAPESRNATWDAIRGDYGIDIAFIDRALTSVFQRVAIDPARLTVSV